MNTTTTIPLIGPFAPDHAADVSASRTPGCNGAVFVSVYDEGIELRANGCCSIAGPPDDDDPAPNAGTITGLSPAEAREIAANLLDAAAECEAIAR